MTSEYEFCVDIEVTDPEALYEAALARLVEQGCNEEAEASALRPNGTVDVARCLIALLDPSDGVPGCTVLDTSAWATTV